MVKFKYREAYSLLTYRGECGLEETLWNGGDFEPLFVISCSCLKDDCKARHVDWTLNARKIDFKPPNGMRGFALEDKTVVLKTF